MSNKQKFNVPICWMMESIVQVEADSLEEAIKKAMADTGIPRGRSVDGSFEVQEALVEAVNEPDTRPDHVQLESSPPRWVPAVGGNFHCTAHDEAAHDCPCPPVHDLHFDPYTTDDPDFDI